MRKVPLQGFEGLGRKVGGDRRAVRPCDHPDCPKPGEHRAPRARDRLNEYYWFCLDHVQAYNKAWNFYSGLNEIEVEQLIEQDSMWQRPTWPLGSRCQMRAGAGGRADAPMRDDFGLFEEERKAARADREARREEARATSRRPLTAIQKALATLELNGPVDLDGLKRQYKTLVKLYHPDANGGDKAAEDRLKDINEAYTRLKTRLSA